MSDVARGIKLAMLQFLANVSYKDHLKNYKHVADCLELNEFEIATLV